jgi:hypothetical protein
VRQPAIRFKPDRRSLCGRSSLFLKRLEKLLSRGIRVPFTLREPPKPESPAIELERLNKRYANFQITTGGRGSQLAGAAVGTAGAIDKTLTVRHLNGVSERQLLDSVADLRAALKDVFLLTLPDTPDLDAGLSRVLRQSG